MVWLTGKGVFLGRIHCEDSNTLVLIGLSWPSCSPPSQNMLQPVLPSAPIDTTDIIIMARAESEQFRFPLPGTVVLFHCCNPSITVEETEAVGEVAVRVEWQLRALTF